MVQGIRVFSYRLSIGFGMHVEQGACAAHCPSILTTAAEQEEMGEALWHGLLPARNIAAHLALPLHLHVLLWHLGKNRPKPVCRAARHIVDVVHQAFLPMRLLCSVDDINLLCMCSLVFSCVSLCCICVCLSPMWSPCWTGLLCVHKCIRAHE